MQGEMRSGIERMIPGNRGKVLYAISQGRDMTKLEIKRATSLSMTTVLTAVDRLAAEGLITVERREAPRGGKPPASVNLSNDRAVYGISYKGGTLYAVAIDLRGEILYRTSTIVTGVPRTAAEEVRVLTEKLKRKAPPPSAIALALNCPDIGALTEELTAAFGAPVFPTTNTAALGALALWQGGAFPLAVIGVGARVKCVFFEEKGRRTLDIGSLPSSVVFTTEGRYDSLLSAPRVAERLSGSRYHGVFLREGGGITETRDLASYSRALARGLSELVDLIDHFLAPRETLLFGEYLSEGFFRLVREGSRSSDHLRRAAVAEEDFAFGAAISALTDGVFNG